MTTCDLSVSASSHRSNQVFYTGTFGRATSLAWMGSPPFLTPQASTLLWRTCLQHPCSLQYGRATLRCWPPSASVANNLLVVLLPLALCWHCSAASLPAYYCCSVLWPLRGRLWHELVRRLLRRFLQVRNGIPSKCQHASQYTLRMHIGLGDSRSTCRAYFEVMPKQPGELDVMCASDYLCITDATHVLQVMRNGGSSTFFTITSITLCFSVEDMSPQQNPFCPGSQASCEHSALVMCAPSCFVILLNKRTARIA